ncbi:type II toxin-antitoxin system VapC family toxin [Rhizobium sp. C1]|uniref:type II toxin-antitoxin system VapC family toxin n=1 Tax=Rhizobium sp. C1 TaxID=1349799 RepID=UPI001E45893B|nr:type II toxin-antitoxin system VapC family toxin [Rhizobium sp. C1]MCD2176585.1 type II toxin-antitoxin system VapC family toxin [Rhizobium sp. C1]
MKILLDTPVLLWVAADSVELDEPARRLILDDGNDLYFSAASIWEIGLRGASSFDGPPVDVRMLRRGLLDAGYREVPLRSEHAMAVGDFEDLPVDSFARLLLAQARYEGLLLMTAKPGLIAQKAGILPI